MAKKEKVFNPEENSSSLKSFLKDVLKDLSKDKEVKEQIQEKEEIATLFSGAPLLDLFLGGGIPENRLTYIWGGESTGKSTISTQILSSFYKQYKDDAIYIYIDTEESFDKKRFQQLGVNVDSENFIILEPITINDIKKFLKKLYLKISTKFQNLEEAPKIFVVWDSVSSTSVDEEYYEDTNKIGPMARAISSFFRNIKFKLWNITMIAISQYRETNIGNPYAAKEPPGGRALRHKAHITLYLTSKKASVIPDDIGREVSIYTQKSKMISPYRKMPFVYFFTTGYDSVITSIFLLLYINYIKKSQKFSVPWSDEKYTLDGLYEYAISGKDSYNNFWLPVFNWIIDMYPEEKDYLTFDVLERIKNYYFDEEGKPILERWTTVSISRSSNISQVLTKKEDDEDKIEIIEEDENDLDL